MSSNPVAYAQKRRSSRIEKAIPLAVQGVDAARAPFREEVATVSISCHGCSCQMKHEVLPGSMLVLDMRQGAQRYSEFPTRARVKWIQKLGAAADPAYGGSIRPSLRSSEALSLVGTARDRPLTTVDTDGLSGAMDGYDGTPYPADDDAFGAAGTFHGLPRRVRPGGGSSARAAAAGGGASAAAGQAGPAPAHVPPEAPAPEHARSLFSSLQSSWLRSRETDDIPDSGAGDIGDSGTSTASGPTATWLDDTEHDAGPRGGTAPHDEEM